MTQSASNGPDPRGLHVAIIMDGNGRWAERQGLPRSAGHRGGIEPVRETVRVSAELGIEALTLFAFSSENFERPADEVGRLMALFLEALDRELAELDANGVRLRFIGDRQELGQSLVGRAVGERLIVGSDEHEITGITRYQEP